MAAHPTQSSHDPAWIETRFREDDHPEWKRSFGTIERKELVDADLQAAGEISFVLLAIVIIGLMLTVLSAVLIRSFS